MPLNCQRSDTYPLELVPILIESGTVVFALYSFTSTNSDDLSLQEGDQCDVCQLLEDPNWLVAVNANGMRGQVPRSYITSATQDPLSRYPWFHGSLSRAKTELELTPRTIDGLFLVRMSTNHPGDLTLSVVCSGQISHYHIRRLTLPGPRAYHCYTIDNEGRFYPLGELVRHYAADADGLCCRLSQPAVAPASVAVAAASLGPDAAVVKSSPDLELQEVLGRGEFGEVRRGVFRGEPVAVKCLSSSGDSNQRSAALRLEAKVMESLNHANLVRFVALMERHGQLLLVTEFMSLGSLLNYLRSRGQSVVTAADQLRFAADVSGGMKYLAGMRLVHRDLAARNVLLDENCQAKVADFGLTVPCGGSLDAADGFAAADRIPLKSTAPECIADRARLSQRIADIGLTVPIGSSRDTVNPLLSIGGGAAADRIPLKWTAPECIADRARFSLQSDVWSFGVLLWEIFSFGRMPYPRMKADQVHSHLRSGFRMEIPDRCPPEVYRLMRDCWELEPLRRPEFSALHDRLLVLGQSAACG